MPRPLQLRLTGPALVAVLLLMILLLALSCQRRLPTRPPDRDLDPQGEVRGTIGDDDAIMKSDVYKDPVTQEAIIVSQFVDLDGIQVGKAELTATSDVTSYLSTVAFNIPGQTFVDMGGHFSMEVTVSNSRIQPDMFQVEMTCIETRDELMFFTEKTPSLQKSDGSDDAQDNGIDIQLFLSAVAGHSVMLCIGTDEMLEEALQCKIQAPNYCDRRGVKNAFLQGSFSLRNGCERGCRVICKTHDQGFIGF